MANHKSAKKRIKTNEKARLRNRRYMIKLRTALRTFREASSKDEAQGLLNDNIALLDSLAGKGIIHKNRAARTKSRMYHKIAKMS